MRLRTAVAAGLLAASCSIRLENDFFGSDDSDRNYTNGLRFQYEYPIDEPPDWVAPWADPVAETLGFVNPSVPQGATPASVAGLVFGQQIYTPEDIEVRALIPDDRPYAGWLYVGLVRWDSVLDDDELRRRDVQTSVELDVGVIGPYSYAEQVQKYAHGQTVSTDPEGWGNQLGTEVGFVLEVQRRSRDLYFSFTGGPWAMDSVSHFGGSLGNVSTKLNVGNTLRFGWNLPRFRGAEWLARQRGERPPDSFYLFAAIDGRYVIQDIFLDGNTFRSSHSVDKEDFVTDVSAGLGLRSGHFELVYARVTRSEEFEGQRSDQSFGAVTLNWSRRF